MLTNDIEKEIIFANLHLQDSQELRTNFAQNLHKKLKLCGNASYLYFSVQQLWHLAGLPGPSTLFCLFWPLIHLKFKLKTTSEKEPFSLFYSFFFMKLGSVSRTKQLAGHIGRCGCHPFE